MKKLLSILLAICLLAGMLSIVASAEDTAPAQAGIRVGTRDKNGKFAHLELKVNAGETKYLVTDDEGVAWPTGATADNYNIKLEYIDGIATIYLKDAKLINNYWHGLEVGMSAMGATAAVNGFQANIVVESDSYIEGRKYQENGVRGSYMGLVYSTKSGIITGPGKLTAKSLCVYAICAPGLTFKDAKVYAENNYDTDQTSPYACVWVRSGDIVIDKSEVTVVNNNGPTLWISESNTSLAGENTKGDIIIKNGSKVDITNKISAVPALGTKNGAFKIDASDVVIHAQSKPFSPKPEMTGVGAVGGTKESNAKAYNEKKAMSYTYFHCGPDVEVPTVETLPPVTVPPVTQQVPPVTQQVPPTTQQQTPPATQQQVPPTTNQQTPPTTQAAPNATEPVDSNTGSGNGTMVILIVLIVIAVLTVGAAAALFIIQKKKGKL